MTETGNPPLKGIKVLEFAGLAPAPFAGLILADAGASVLRIDRPPASKGDGLIPNDPLARRKASIIVDLKEPRGRSLVQRLARHVDVLIEPFRPGVLEKLGLGPEALLAANPRLIYGRMAGFRRDGKYAAMAGHDINYLAVSGALAMLGRAGERPHAPINILGDFAGGGAMLAQGILLALVARNTSGRGQVVEANMVDGSSYLMSFPRMLQTAPGFDRARGLNLIDGGAPFYDTYETADGQYMAVGAIEPQFFRALMRGLGLESQGWEAKRSDPQNWPALRATLTQIFKSKTRSEWEGVFDGTDACCTPVLSYHELRTRPGREGDQRAPVFLAETPLSPASAYQGRGYDRNHVPAGRGGEQLLAEWLGWENGTEYHVCQNGALAGSDASTTSKL